MLEMEALDHDVAATNRNVSGSLQNGAARCFGGEGDGGFRGSGF